MIPFREIPEPSPRKRLSLSEKLAACLVKMTGPDGEPLIPAPEGKTVDEINASVRWDHRIPRELMGSDHPVNLHPLPIRYHEAVKTPADAKNIAKARHNRKAEQAFRAKVLAKSIGDDQPRDIRRHRIPSRPFNSKGKRPFRNRRTG